MTRRSQDHSGAAPSADQEHTSVVRTYYEDDHDDNDGLTRESQGSENTPLINTTNGTRAGLIQHRARNISDHSLHTLQQKSIHRGAQQQRRHSEEPLKLTWTEWAIENGLHPSTWTKHTYFRASLLLIFLTLVILAFTVFRVQDHIKDILKYIDDHKNIGAILFVTFYTVACWLFLPGSLFTIGAGFLFKPMPFALAIVLLGDVFGAIGSFLFGRYIFYDWVKGMMSKHPKFHALDQVIQDDGWKIVVMLRLTPIPFNLITYFFSITSISLYTLVWATIVGIFPGSCLGIWIGSLLKGLSGIDNPELETKNVVILAMNGVFIVCSILTLSIFGKRSLRKAMRKLDKHHSHLHEDEHRGLLSAQEIDSEQGLVDRDIDDNGDDDYLEDALHAEETEEEEEGVSSTTGSEATVIAPETAPLGPSGFTRGEKWMFVGIAAAALINISVCLPLYYHYANQDD